jgi:hypothetical protein
MQIEHVELYKIVNISSVASPALPPSHWDIGKNFGESICQHSAHRKIPNEVIPEEKVIFFYRSHLNFIVKGRH